jgi:hypothetical protein
VTPTDPVSRVLSARGVHEILRQGSPTGPLLLGDGTARGLVAGPSRSTSEIALPPIRADDRTVADEETVAEFRDLWDPPDRYVLVRVGPGVDQMVIVDPVDRMITLIDEDDELAAQVIRRMRAAGVQVLDELPPMS